MAYKTMEELLASNKAYLTPCEVAGVLGTTDQQVRVCARQRRDLLGFRTIIMGSRVKIPRIPFLQYLGVKGAGDGPTAEKDVVSGGQGQRLRRITAPSVAAGRSDRHGCNGVYPGAKPDV